MGNSRYTINKGINAPIEFRGLKGQYIGYLALGLVGVLVLFVMLYLGGLNTFMCLGIAVAIGAGLFFWIYRSSAKYGPYGLRKKAARKRFTGVIISRSRQVFRQEIGKNK